MSEGSFDPTPGTPQSDALLRRLLSELAAGRESAPDLTDSVMSKLGFVRCSAVEAQRERREIFLRRSAVAALVMVAALGGYLIASERETTRPMAIMPAFGGAIERQTQQIEALAQSMPRWRSAAELEASSVTVLIPGFLEGRLVFVPVQLDQPLPSSERVILDEDMGHPVAVGPFPQT